MRSAALAMRFTGMIPAETKAIFLTSAMRTKLVKTRNVLITASPFTILKSVLATLFIGMTPAITEMTK